MRRRSGKSRAVDPVDLLPGGWICAIILASFEDYGDFYDLWESFTGTADKQDAAAREWVRQNVADDVIRDNCSRFARGEY